MWVFFILSFQPLSVWMCVQIQQPLCVLPLCLPGVLSVLGNGTLLFVAYRKKSSLKPAEFFVVNLAISDLSMTMSLFPLAIPSAFAHMWVTVQISTISLIFTGDRITCCSHFTKSFHQLVAVSVNHLLLNRSCTAGFLSLKERAPCSNLKWVYESSKSEPEQQSCSQTAKHWVETCYKSLHSRGELKIWVIILYVHH